MNKYDSQLQQEIEAETLLITLTERLLWFADEKGAIFAPQIRKLVREASVDSEHGQ